MTLTLGCEILGPMRYKCSGLDQAKINAELRERFGDTCTRTQIMEYREETGNDPRWIRKGSQCNIGRGLYRIPGGDNSSQMTPKRAKREQVVTDDDLTRSVISSPFDDGYYDEPEAETPAAPAKPKRGRKSKSGGADDQQAIHNQPTYDPGIGELAAPVFIHAWICDARASAHCPGRKPGTAYGPDGAPPVCECGSPMTRHSWAPGRRLF